MCLQVTVYGGRVGASIGIEDLIDPMASITNRLEFGHPRQSLRLPGRVEKPDKSALGVMGDISDPLG